MAEWLGAHMQDWPTWAIVAALIVITIIWAIGAHLSAAGYDSRAIWPFYKKQYLGEKGRVKK